MWLRSIFTTLAVGAMSICIIGGNVHAPAKGPIFAHGLLQTKLGKAIIDVDQDGNLSVSNIG